jgi:hypothetical protein
MASDRGIITLQPAALDSVHHVCNIYSHASELLTLIWDFHKSECFDPRDRIFALHSLAEDVVPSVASETSLELERKVFYVDYTSPWIEVYRGFALECVAAGNWRVLLKHLFAFGALWEQQRDPRIPAWIPAWNKVRQLPDYMAHVPSRTPHIS